MLGVFQILEKYSWHLNWGEIRTVNASNIANSYISLYATLTKYGRNIFLYL